jgi:hypothetical protein
MELILLFTNSYISATIKSVFYLFLRKKSLVFKTDASNYKLVYQIMDFLKKGDNGTRYPFHLVF